jgi:hypothetical protein
LYFFLSYVLGPATPETGGAGGAPGTGPSEEREYSSHCEFSQSALDVEYTDPSNVIQINFIFSSSQTRCEL